MKCFKRSSQEKLQAKRVLASGETVISFRRNSQEKFQAKLIL